MTWPFFFISGHQGFGKPCLRGQADCQILHPPAVQGFNNTSWEIVGKLNNNKKDKCISNVASLLLHTLSAALPLASTFSCTQISAFIHSDTRMLKIQQYKHKIHGFRTFSCFGPHIWNSLPQDFRVRHCSTLSSFNCSQTENLPLLTVFPPQQIPIPSFCYSHCVCVCVCVCVRVCVCVCVFIYICKLFWLNCALCVYRTLYTLG